MKKTKPGIFNLRHVLELILVSDMPITNFGYEFFN